MNVGLTRDSLAELLNERGVNPSAYCLTGGLPNESYCIDRDGSDWVVYYCEKGLRSGIERFENESDACSRLVTILMSDNTTQQ